MSQTLMNELDRAPQNMLGNKVVLIGNYAPDQQQSMNRFSDLLARNFLTLGISTAIWRPSVVLGKFTNSPHRGIGKWLGYVDKFLLFPFKLRLLTLGHPNVRYHIGDHSNAMYLAVLPRTRTSITCHDVLAIRGALGHEDAVCRASPTGKLLQWLIKRALLRANKLATVSKLTMEQLQELEGDGSCKPDWRVIYNALNADFRPLSNVKCQPILGADLVSEKPFLLHVGTNLARKNRRLLIDLIVKLGDRWTGDIVFAGKSMDEGLRSYAAQSGALARIKEFPDVSHETLVALYSSCAAFIFPSFSEGFGWPIIEAQACCAPVITSSVAPMPEIGGQGALYADPKDPGQFAEQFLKLESKTYRESLVQNGLKNVSRFSGDLMTNNYLNLIFSNSVKS